MARLKTFFIYFMLVVLFFIFSQIVIYVAINTTYAYKSVDIKSSIPVKALVEATSINGRAKITVKNDTQSEIENKYIQIRCFSKHEVLMGTKYIKIDKIQANEEKEFEIHFNFDKVEKAEIDIIDEKAFEDNNVYDEEQLSDIERNIAETLGA